MAQRSAGKYELGVGKVATVLALGIDPTFADLTSISLQLRIDKGLNELRC
jgi:hypothetical protein